MLSPADVMFGRACLSFGLVNREQLFSCVADQRRMATQGRLLTLAQIMIGHKLISVDVYRQVVERIRHHMQQQAQQHQHQQQAQPVPPPDITSSGRYQDVPTALAGMSATGQPLPPGLGYENVHAAQPTQAAPWQQEVANPPSEEEIKEAARTWDDASSVVESTGYDIIPGTLESSSHDGPIIVTPQAVKERKDTGIRRILGISEGTQEFDFGPYRILGDIASGGMGIIYRARASDTGRVYALKALINVENANEKQLRRFIQEAQSAMRLDHPGIVKIHDIGIVESIPYFTMDLIEGQDLQRHLKLNTFGLENLLQIVGKVCEAVHYAHENQVIHRDLKPANVVIRTSDNFPILTDFGLAKNLDSTFKLTAEGAMVGTPLFLSPEQVAGKGHEVDRRCDVYGMGVMLYQILTKRLPFVGRNPYEVYRKVLEEDPTPPAQVNPAVSPDLEKICLMALAKDRDERYPSCLDMSEDIGRYLRGESVQAKLPTPVTVAKAREKGGSRRKKMSVARFKARKDVENKPSKLVLLGIIFMVMLIVAGLGVIAYLLVTGERF